MFSTKFEEPFILLFSLLIVTGSCALQTLVITCSVSAFPQLQSCTTQLTNILQFTDNGKFSTLLKKHTQTGVTWTLELTGRILCCNMEFIIPILLMAKSIPS